MPNIASALLENILKLYIFVILILYRDIVATENRSVGGSIPPLGTIRLFLIIVFQLFTVTDYSIVPHFIPHFTLA